MNTMFIFWISSNLHHLQICFLFYLSKLYIMCIIYISKEKYYILDNKTLLLKHIERDIQYRWVNTSLHTYLCTSNNFVCWYICLSSSRAVDSKIFRWEIETCIVTHKSDFFIKKELKLHAEFSSFSKNKLSSYFYSKMKND